MMYKIAGSTDPSADRSRALSEGRRLMREVDWLHAIHAAPSRYLPMIESALALGVQEQDTILLDLDARFRHFLFLFPKNSYALGGRDDKHTAALQHLADLFGYQRPSLERSDQLAHLLPLARELLHQTSWYLEHMGRDGLDGGTDLWQVYSSYLSNEIWYAIQGLSWIRAWIIISRPISRIISGRNSQASPMNSTNSPNAISRC
jgi:hypothetical protein